MPADTSDSENAKPGMAPSRPLDVYSNLLHPSMARIAQHLIQEIDGLREAAGGNRRRSDAVKPFSNAVRILATDLLRAHRETPDLLVGISLDNNAFSSGSRYGSWHLTARTFRDAYEGMRDLGYLEVVHEGFHDPNRKKGFNTKVRGTTKLAALLDPDVPFWPWEYRRDPTFDPIIRKGEKPARSDKGENAIRPRQRKAEQIPHGEDDASPVEWMRGRLARINEVLERHWVDLHVTDAEFAALANRMMNSGPGQDGNRGPLHLDRRTLYRVFNNGSWEQGGRFYGAWWQGVPKEWRICITIDGKPTIEMDYSGMHPLMLYLRAGAALPDDPYDPVKVGLQPSPETRTLVKRIFNAMLNAGPNGVAPPSPPADFMPEMNRRAAAHRYFDHLVSGPDGKPIVTFKKLTRRIADMHEPIAEHFFSGVGLKLQTVDARIAEKVMLHFARSDIPVLPVHDSFLMHHAYQAELETVMKSAFEEEVGGSILVKAAPSWLIERSQGRLTHQRELEQSEARAEDGDLDILLDGTPFDGWTRRQDAWFAQRGSYHPLTTALRVSEEGYLIDVGES